MEELTWNTENIHQVGGWKVFALPQPGFQVHSTPASLGRMRVPPSPAVGLCPVARPPQGTLQHNSQRWVFGRRKLSLHVVLVAEVLWGTAADSFKLTALEKKFCIVQNFPGNLVPGLVCHWEFYCTDVASTQKLCWHKLYWFSYINRIIFDYIQVVDTSSGSGTKTHSTLVLPWPFPVFFADFPDSCGQTKQAALQINAWSFNSAERKLAGWREESIWVSSCAKNL